MQFNPMVSNATQTVYEVSNIFLIDLITCGVRSTRIVMVDNAPLFRVFDEECNTTRRLSELIRQRCKVFIHQFQCFEMSFLFNQRIAAFNCRHTRKITKAKKVQNNTWKICETCEKKTGIPTLINSFFFFDSRPYIYLLCYHLKTFKGKWITILSIVSQCDLHIVTDGYMAT